MNVIVLLYCLCLMLALHTHLTRWFIYKQPMFNLYTLRYRRSNYSSVFGSNKTKGPKQLHILH
jgi:hypothetical protein